MNNIGNPNFDPDNRHLAIWDTSAAFYPFHIESPRTDALAAEARASLDEDLRRRNYEEYFDIGARACAGMHGHFLRPRFCKNIQGCWRTDSQESSG